MTAAKMALASGLIACSLVASYVVLAPQAAQAQATPPACVCTASEVSYRMGASFPIANCQCGALQCVANVSAITCK